MDQQSQQHHPMNEDHPPLAPAYGFYPPDQEPPYNLGYGSMPPYHPVVQHGPQTRQLDLHQQQQQGMQPYNIGLMSNHQFTNPVYPSTPHVLPISGSPPPSPDMYDPLSPPVSGSDTSADGLYHHSNSSGANSPSSSRGNSLVQRHVRYNPTPSPTSSSGRRHPRSRSRGDSEDDEGMGVSFAENLAHSRKEATRRQRIEAEQRRRDELRDGYAKLKDVLPVSNQKSSKVSLLERATNHIVALENTNKDLLARINQLEQDIQRLRAINEKISLGSTETPSPPMFDGRPPSPPPDAPLAPTGHPLPAAKEPPSDNSSPSSDNGY
ncbi:hypothetical protein BDN72DRAFT_48475 [Pluteus cervinus]|uniref:Uncharacterized protein n=1 Tax=Pluteus cervinus TaxID=181527 RepID=A0ACD3BIH2_9AGAR|nr:hypothetical protein BDN72DRAFT_48475 [Pluteus cervinus]